MPVVLKRGGGYGEFCLRTDAKPSGQAGNRRAKQADSEGESEGEGEGDRHGAIMKMNANGGEGSQGRSVGKGSKMMRLRPTKALLVLLKEQLGLLQHQKTPLWAQKELIVKYLSAVHKVYIILSMKIYKYILMSIKVASSKCIKRLPLICLLFWRDGGFPTSCFLFRCET